MGVITKLRQGLSFASAVTEHIVNGCENVTEEVKTQRMNICSGCDMFDKENVKCNACGCMLGMKASWAISRCPLSKW